MNSRWYSFTLTPVLSLLLADESINECAFMLDSCDENALCTDTAENYTCSCTPGFTGNGFICSSTSMHDSRCIVDGLLCFFVTRFLSSCSQQTLMSVLWVWAAVGPMEHAWTLSAATHVSVILATLMTEASALVSDTTNLQFLGCRLKSYHLLYLPSDVDECTIGTHNCDENAKCTDTDGSFECSCITGYYGPGDICYSESIHLYQRTA